MRTVSLAAVQFTCSWDKRANVGKAKEFVRAAAARGANVVLLQEFFEMPYFCQDQSAGHFALAASFEGNALIAEMAELAKALNVALPISFFEKAGHVHFNALAMIDADGTVLGCYRKSHIPDGPGYQEKYYFTPGDTGFRAWRTRFGVLGVGICWDQWFPEAARAMALQGAEVLLYPTAIGSEPPPAPPIDSRDHWRRVMQGHAAANCMPLVASNRVGVEKGRASELTFYGSSFVADATGAIVAELRGSEEGFTLASFDLDDVAKLRASWGLFRDRRPDLYGALTSYDGG
ncbi:MAG: N-carbamoylputrescine amidase [Alphaproteobacteria bacterium]|nr:N-carbamoylputrescine amidase [Alphaproteobacteria bacterium]MDE2110746.1 N-carbamoylputrescine amidase [Alphaproteobacteria bacterium]MDE2494551.1 N-carbamoylputrescine amidase [Alphaproteobacteria bacterium]